MNGSGRHGTTLSLRLLVPEHADNVINLVGKLALKKQAALAAVTHDEKILENLEHIFRCKIGSWLAPLKANWHSSTSPSPSARPSAPDLCGWLP
jgi:hypothetical protein